MGMVSGQDKGGGIPFGEVGQEELGISSVWRKSTAARVWSVISKGEDS